MKLDSGDITIGAVIIGCMIALLPLLEFQCDKPTGVDKAIRAACRSVEESTIKPNLWPIFRANIMRHADVSEDYGSGSYTPNAPTGMNALLQNVKSKFYTLGDSQYDRVAVMGIKHNGVGCRIEWNNGRIIKREYYPN